MRITQKVKDVIKRNLRHIISPVVPYFSIFNRITPQEHLMSGFLMEENPSHTLFLPIEQYKTLAVP